MAVKAEMTVRQRVLRFVLAVVLMGLAGFLTYDAGRRAAGFDMVTSTRESAALQDRADSLTEELGSLRSLAAASESRLIVEENARKQLEAELRKQQSQSAALREELALFEGLAVDAPASSGGVRVARARLEALDSAGRIRFRLLVINSGFTKGGRQFEGELKFELMLRQGGRPVSISIPESGDDFAAFRVSVGYFRRVEGEFRVPADAVVESGEVKLMQGGALRSRQPLTLM